MSETNEPPTKDTSGPRIQLTTIGETQYVTLPSGELREIDSAEARAFLVRGGLSGASVELGVVYDPEDPTLD